VEAGNQKVAQAHLAKALQVCPDSGPLWACAIDLESKPQKKAKSYDALKKCHDDPFVFVAVAGYDCLASQLYLFPNLISGAFVEQFVLGGPQD
jgi:hypothetical protein